MNSCVNKNLILLVILLCAVSPVLFPLKAQEPGWKAGIFSFFDNEEFGGSAYRIPQTMAGVRAVPQLMVRYDTVHSISFGADLLHEFGSVRAIDGIMPLAWYEYSREDLRFMIGAFPRRGSLDYYPASFFRDSVKYYRPVVNGIFLEHRRQGSYYNIWLDWTGRQTEVVREAFLIGTGLKHSFGCFYIKQNSYLYHFAGTSDPGDSEALHDNGLMLLAAGADFGEMTRLDKSDLSVGLLSGLERARGEGTGWISHAGLLIELRAEYRWLGLFNSYYKGSRLMHFYADHHNELYWGDPAYRSGSYNRTDLYVRFMKESRVDLKLGYTLHMLEGKFYHQQVLSLTLDLGGIHQ